jgi:DNA-binding CsgD family transcriptional regulator
MTNQGEYLKRFIDNSAILSHIFGLLDLKLYFLKINKHAKHAHDKECLVSLTIGTLSLHLTEREAHCALLSIFGYTAQEISKLMILSPRTVEHYLSRIKKKLYLQRKSEFITTLLQSDFVHNMQQVINKYSID